MAKGQHTVCFCDNGPAGTEYARVFCEVVRQEGLIPEFYIGMGTSIRSSNQDRSVRDSFYGAEVVVVRFAGSDPLDNWALPELEGPQERSPVARFGKKYLIYADALEAAHIAGLDARLVGPVRRISGITDFGKRLETDLRAILGRSSPPSG
jgi:hypothetical protein